MLAQLYRGGILRIFDAKGNELCDMKVSPCLKSGADKQLRRLKLRRRESWCDTCWGSEAKIRFDR